MRYRLCVLLALLPGPIAAGQASPGEFPRGLVDTGVFSSLGTVPEVNPRLFRADAVQKPASGAGLLPGEVVFPVSPRPAAQHAREGVTAASAVRSTFQYEPSPSAAAVADADSTAGSVTVMEPIHVPGSKVREMADAMEAAQEFREAEAFHVTTGGRLAHVSLGDDDIEFGVWRHEVLIPEATHLGIPKLVVDLVHIKW
jgi:hypothetical protein